MSEIYLLFKFKIVAEDNSFYFRGKRPEDLNLQLLLNEYARHQLTEVVNNSNILEKQSRKLENNMKSLFGNRKGIKYI